MIEDWRLALARQVRQTLADAEGAQDAEAAARRDPTNYTHARCRRCFHLMRFCSCARAREVIDVDEVRPMRALVIDTTCVEER